ncbi:IS200/IS605 family transposase [Longimicrobium sp.]|uniref:IS200/IS605 family transposase n=1 Tax=Longimicrobium sp. TaxID=2029185 RepID=UPI003B3A73F5
MRSAPWTQLYLHLVWATWNRAPLLTPRLMEAVDRCIRAECVQMRVEVIAFGGVADHVHLLVRIPTTITVADLVKQVKGSSSHMLGQRMRVAFRWQGKYGAFSLSTSHVERIRGYVLNQEQHHADGTSYPLLELPSDEDEPGRAQEPGPGS